MKLGTMMITCFSYPKLWGSRDMEVEWCGDPLSHWSPKELSHTREEELGQHGSRDTIPPLNYLPNTRSPQMFLLW